MSEGGTRARDKWVVALGLMAGAAATVGVTRYQYDWHDRYFEGNAAFYGISQLCVLIALLPFRPRAASLAGISLLTAVYLVLFNAWVFSSAHPDGGTWAIYLIALVAETVAAVKSLHWLRSRPWIGPGAAGLVSTAFALAAIAIVHGFFFTVVWIGTRA